MSQEEDWMKIAIGEAAKAPWPFGAVIIRDGVPLSKAGAGDGKDNLIDPTAHAEINAIRFACAALNTSTLTGAVMYASCEPCAMCMCALWYAGIRHLVYGSPIAEEEALFAWKDLSFPEETLADMMNNELSVTKDFCRDEVVAMYKSHPSYTKEKA